MKSIKTTAIFTLILFINSCKTHLSETKTFRITNNQEDTILELKDDNTIYNNSSVKIASFSKNKIIDVDGEIIAEISENGSVIDKNKKPLFQFNEDKLDNGSGKLIGFDANGIFNLNENQFLKIEPNDKELYKTANLLVALTYLIEPNSETIKIKSNTMNTNNYPKIELYFEQDYAEKNTGSDKQIDANGKVYYMGSREHQPYVNKKNYTFNENNKNQLLNLELTFLPYFKEIKPDITLQEYFKAIEEKNATIFPKDLNGFLQYPFEEERSSFETIIEYQKSMNQSVTIIWIDENRYFVNNVFYRAELDEILKDTGFEIQEKFAEGKLKNYMQQSTAIQSKLTEGYAYLSLNQNTTTNISISPKNTTSMQYQETPPVNKVVYKIKNAENPSLTDIYVYNTEIEMPKDVKVNTGNPTKNHELEAYERQKRDLHFSNIEFEKLLTAFLNNKVNGTNSLREVLEANFNNDSEKIQQIISADYSYTLEERDIEVYDKNDYISFYYNETLLFNYLEKPIYLKGEGSQKLKNFIKTKGIKQ